MTTNKVNFGYYEKLFQHFRFSNNHLLRETISANIYTVNIQQCGTVGIFVTNTDYTECARNAANNSNVKIYLATKNNLKEVFKNISNDISKADHNNFKEVQIEYIAGEEINLNEMKFRKAKMKNVIVKR